MLMANYLQRFLFKWKYAILIIFVFSAMMATFSFQINRWLPQYALSLAHTIGQESQTKIFFRTARYHFPDHIILKDVKIFGIDGKNPMLQAPRVTVGFFNKIIIDGLMIDFPILKNYLTRYSKKNRTWARTIPPKGIHLVVPNGEFYPTGHNKGNPIAFNTDLTLNQGHLNAMGSLGDNDKFNYTLNGTIRNAGFDMDKFTLEDGRSSMNLWGSWQDNDIDWKGFIFYDKLYILDIDGHLNIQNNDIILKKLSFSVNGNDVAASGHCLTPNPFQCDANIALRNTSLHLHAQNSPQGIVFNGMIDVQNIHLGFEDLTARIVNDNLLKLKIKRLQSIFSVQDTEHSLPLENVLASINFAYAYRKDISLSAQMYAGALHSHIFLNTSSLPWQIKGQGKFEGMDINRLNNDFSSFKQCHGLFSGNFNFQAPKDIEITGNLGFHNGNFNDSDFQKWVAKILQMPGLNHVSGADLSCRFKINGRSKTLDDLKLNTDNFNLNGFFHLDDDDLVSSQVSASFSKKLLSESPIGRDIIGLVRGAWTLPFEFDLSGNVYRMNFQWNNSPLKDKVHQHLFSFVERMIDRRMDARSYNFTIQRESVSPG